MISAGKMGSFAAKTGISREAVDVSWKQGRSHSENVDFSSSQWDFINGDVTASRPEGISWVGKLRKTSMRQLLGKYERSHTHTHHTPFDMCTVCK